MKKWCASVLLCAALLLGPSAQAAGSVLVDGAPLENNASAQVRNNTTYVALRTVAQALRPTATVVWENGQATVRDSTLSLTARPGSIYIAANDRAIYLPDGVRLEDGCTLVPVRALASALGAQVDWDADTGTVYITSGAAAFAAYDSNSLYWLSRIISAESQGESLLGKIAVGNVVLNRVASAEFPDSIYGVIFDDRWGGQFEPVRNGSIYQEPTEESVLAAKLVLEGASVAGNSLYFLSPSLTSNHWIMNNRPYVMTIGCHWFYA